MRLTTIGQKYLETAQRITELDTEFHRYVEDELGCAQGNLVVGSSPFRSTYFLAAFLPQFQEKYPGIRLQLAEHTSKRLEESVLSGDVDLIIATQPVNTDAFAFAELYSEEWYSYCRPIMSSQKRIICRRTAMALCPSCPSNF